MSSDEPLLCNSFQMFRQCAKKGEVFGNMSELLVFHVKFHQQLTNSCEIEELANCFVINSAEISDLYVDYCKVSFFVNLRNFQKLNLGHGKINPNHWRQVRRLFPANTRRQSNGATDSKLSHLARSKNDEICAAAQGDTRLYYRFLEQ